MVVPTILKSKEVNQILRQPSAPRARALRELVRIAQEEPDRLQVQRSCYTKVIRTFGKCKRKMWREALWFLSKSRDFLINDDVFMYNTVLQVLSEGSQWFPAVALLNHMLVYGPFPDIASFNTVLSALKRNRSRLWQRSLHVLTALPQASLMANERTYSICLASVAPCATPAVLKDLVTEMRESGSDGNVVRTVLGKALAETNDWQSCLDMLKDFQSSGGVPDAKLLTCCAVCCGRKLKWQHALKLLSEGDWHAQRNVGLRSAVEYTLRRAQREEIAEEVRLGRPKAAAEFEGTSSVEPRNPREHMAQARARLAACGAGGWAEALLVLEEGWQHRTLNGEVLRQAIEVCGEQAWRWAIYILDKASERGLSNVKICDAVMGTLQYAWRTALELLEDMPRQRIAWSVFSCSRCIYACAVGGDCLEVDHVRRFQTSARREQEM
eukprot:symbB.v1.2.012984.t1/scaffold909.1/size153080/3